MQKRRRVAVGLTALMWIGGSTAVAQLPGPALPVPVPGAASTPIGLSRLLAAADGTTGSVTGIATLAAVPTDAVTGALGALGLEVQPMRHVPLAIVRGPAAAMQAAVASGLAADVYPDEAIQLLDTASSDSLGAAATRAAGLTGKGATVAVVDSGCDATHPDLADHVTHNVKLISA